MPPRPRQFRHRPPRELPSYRALAWVATQPLPEALRQREDDSRAATGASRLHTLASAPLRPAANDPLYTALVVTSAPTLAFATAGTVEGSCWLAFTSRLRAARYLDQMPIDHRASDVRPLAFSASQFVDATALAHEAGIPRVVVDPCAYCPHGLAVPNGDLQDADAAIATWAVATAEHQLRTHVFLSYALETARAGRFGEARDVALAAVAHVTAEEPHLHLLIGLLGVALRSPALVREAQLCLRSLDVHALTASLAAADLLGVADFDRVRIPD